MVAENGDNCIRTLIKKKKVLAFRQDTTVKMATPTQLWSGADGYEKYLTPSEPHLH